LALRDGNAVRDHRDLVALLAALGAPAKSRDRYVDAGATRTTSLCGGGKHPIGGYRPKKIAISLALSWT
jgi:hypothetical protein